MEFTVEREHILYGLGTVSRLAASRMPLPVLNNILIVADPDGLTFSVTDLELGIETAVLATVKKTGKFTVPAKLLHEFIQSSNDRTFEGKVEDNTTLILSSEHTSVRMRGLDASEFPNLPRVEGAPTFLLNAKILKETITQVLFATAVDDTRPVLAGVFLTSSPQGFYLVATDSYRLAERLIKAPTASTVECSVIVPKSTLLEVSRVVNDDTVDISVFVGDNQIQFVYQSTRIISRLIEGNYPPYQNIIPEGYQTRVTAHTGDLTASLKTTQLFARDAGGMIKCLVVPGDGMTIQSVADQKGEAVSRLTAITEGEELTIAFNVKYLLDALSVIHSDNVFIEFSGSERPAIIRPANTKEYLSLVMPLKVD